MGIKQKEKYSEYSSEQAIEAINRCSELYREYLKIEEKISLFCKWKQDKS